MKKLTDDQKPDNKLRKKFESEFRNYKFTFEKFTNGEYLYESIGLNFSCFKFGYLHGRKATK